MNDRTPTSIHVVAPSTLAQGEDFALGLRVLTQAYPTRWLATHARHQPAVDGPFNRSPRGIHYLDNVVPEWRGRVRIACEQLEGPAVVDFAEGAGPYPGDRRPIRRVPGLRFTAPGTYRIRVHDTDGTLEGLSNPIVVSGDAPPVRLFWGDLHVHTFFTDALRIPEELYAFARDEAFLDCCALTDHSEAISDAQWRSFCATTNAFDQPGRFATLVAGEWTSMEYGHRNYYYRGDAGAILRANDERTRHLGDFYAAARAAGAMVAPHHTANPRMGTDFSEHAADIERFVEVHSTWGNSERSEAQGNPLPIRTNGGECDGRHVQDALRKGLRLGMIGSGDTHDGRPGDALHFLQEEPEGYRLLREQGIVGIWAPELTREAIFDALWQRRCFATTNRRIIVRFSIDGAPMGAQIRSDSELAVAVSVSAPGDIASVELVGPEGDVAQRMGEGPDLDWRLRLPASAQERWFYLRVSCADGGMAWSSPIWINGEER